MRRHVTKICVFVFLFGLTSTVCASVQQGRELLFNNGNPTYSGLLAANDEFEAAVASNPNDQEANLFYAVTRLGAFALEQGSGGVLETLRDLLEAFGISRNQTDFIDQGSPFNDPPELYGKYDPPETIPGGEEIRTFQAGPIVNLVDAAILNLNRITNDFETTLTATETGDTAIEVDYGDVLMFKSALYAVKASALIVTGYDADDIDLRELFLLGNAGFLELQRNLLDKYPDLLDLRGDGAPSLASAKLALLNSIDTYQESFNFITTEPDYQGDDLLYFASEKEENEAEAQLTLFTELENSLLENRAGTFTPYTEQIWTLADGNNERLRLEIKKDVNGNFSEGDARGLDGCDFVFCVGGVDGFNVIGSTITIKLIAGGWCPVSATLTGTLSAGGDQITNGTYTGTNFCSGPINGTFMGQLESTETKTIAIDFNRLFGNTGKAPLDIRAILPELDQDNDILAGTFPQPILGLLSPDITTEKEFVEVTDLELVYDVPVATITLDGSGSEWAGVASVIEDDQDQGAPSHDDMKALYVARLNDNLYWMMELHDPPAANEVLYNMDFSPGNGFNEWLHPHYDSQVYRDSGGNKQYWLHSHYWWTIGTISDDPADAGINQVIEARVPLYLFEGESKVLVRAWTELSGVRDIAHNSLLRLPTASVSGTVNCPDCVGPGRIFIWASDGPGPYGNVLAKTHISSPGTYTISGLPIDSQIYIFAGWDADDNGIVTPGDYSGNSGMLVVQSGGNSGVDFIVQDIVEGPFSIYGSVMNVNTPGSGLRTYLEVDIGGDFIGTLPDDIDAITIRGPNGDLPYDKSDFIYYPKWNGFFINIPGSPDLGKYTFIVTSGGLTTTATDYQNVNKTLPIPDSSTFSPPDGAMLKTTTPTFTWDPVSYPATTMYYRFEIVDQQGNRVFATSRNEGMLSFTVPTGVLKRGRTCSWRVRAMDSSNWVDVQNRSNSNWLTFTIRTALPWIPLLIDD